MSFKGLTNEDTCIFNNLKKQNFDYLYIFFRSARTCRQFLPLNLTNFYDVQAALPDWAIFLAKFDF